MEDERWKEVEVEVEGEGRGRRWWEEEGNRPRTRTHINSIILPTNIRHPPHNTIHRRMKPMIILRREPKYTHAPAHVPLRVLLVRVPEQTGDGELAALYPEFGGFGDGGEGHEAAVCAGDETGGVRGGFDGARVGFEFAVEEFVECFCGWVLASSEQQAESREQRAAVSV